MDLTSTKQLLSVVAIEHNTVIPPAVRLELATLLTLYQLSAQ